MTIAWNQYGNTYIENVVKDGTLYSASGAIANEDVAFSAQYMNATGSTGPLKRIMMQVLMTAILSNLRMAQ